MSFTKSCEIGSASIFGKSTPGDTQRIQTGQPVLAYRNILLKGLKQSKNSESHVLDLFVSIFSLSFRDKQHLFAQKSGHKREQRGKSHFYLKFALLLDTQKAIKSGLVYLLLQ